MKPDRTVKLLVCRDENHERPTVVCSERASHPRFSREGQNLILEEIIQDRTVKPTVCRDANHESSMLNELDIDFRIPRLPHSVKQADNYRVRQLVKQIENHPHRQALQRDLQQNSASNPFSGKSKKMIKDRGNVELFELFKRSWNAMHRMPNVLESWHRLLQLRAVLERKWSQKRLHSMYIGLSLDSKIMALRRDELMATDVGKLQNKENIMLPIFGERCIKRHF